MNPAEAIPAAVAIPAALALWAGYALLVWRTNRAR